MDTSTDNTRGDITLADELESIERHLTKSSFKLDPKVKEQWLKDLRSGTYMQGTQYLLTSNKEAGRYCCMGVLGISLGVEKARLKGRMHLSDSGVGLGDDVPLTSSLESFLAYLNDTATWSFVQIADWVEKHL